MILLIFILIYTLSVIVLLISVYIKDTNCKTIGDVFDESKTFMYLPFVNTIAIIVVIIVAIIWILIIVLSLDELYNKIRNIKLR